MNQTQSHDMQWNLSLSKLVGIGVLLWSSAGRILAGSDAASFAKDILPVLYNHCFVCHSQKQTKPKGKLRLDSADAIQGSEVIIPGRPDESELMKRVSLPHDDADVMPPLKGGAHPCSDAERLLLRKWIADGANLDGWVKFEHRGVPEPELDPLIAGQGLKELSLKLQNLVDCSLDVKGTKVNAPVDDETFLRRVYLDVVGRIPSLAESLRFLESKHPDKRSLLIHELLNSEGYVSHTFNWKADQLRLLSGGLPGQPGWLYDEWVKNSIRSHLTYDQYVRELITASGYLWENGAVGFYLRDLGMPLDHMSNLTRVFLGTRIECAQCHDHPLEPVAQRDFYQMVAYTFPVSNMYSSAGYSLDNVKQWPELKARMDAMQVDEAFRQGLSRTISFLKRQTKDTEHQITFPSSYKYDEALVGMPVGARTLFGDEASDRGNLREAFADWMISARNPRFARNIANRLWKRVMGLGLIEPVDSLSVVNKPEHLQIMDFLTQAMMRLRFDERAFLEMLLNTRLYQSESMREEATPGSAFPMRGPMLRRLSAEQLWDSLLVLLVDAVDERKSLLRRDHSELDPERLRLLTAMSAEQIIERAKVEMDQRIKHRKRAQQLAQQTAERNAAKARGDEAEFRRLHSEHELENERYEAERNAAQMGSQYFAKESDARWKDLPHDLVRASEIPTPIPLGHFLRQFGQSDRREIDAFNREANATHSLALMNGSVTRRVLEPSSRLRIQLRAQETDFERIRAIFLAVLVRTPDAGEVERGSSVFKTSPTPETDLIWALLNTPEFLFLE